MKDNLYPSVMTFTFLERFELWGDATGTWVLSYFSSLFSFSIQLEGHPVNMAETLFIKVMTLNHDQNEIKFSMVGGEKLAKERLS